MCGISAVAAAICVQYTSGAMMVMAAYDVYTLT